MIIGHRKEPCIEYLQGIVVGLSRLNVKSWLCRNCSLKETATCENAKFLMSVCRK
jgi:hypothetical protein